ncbi:uncharacterized protein LOC142340357 [Convolutriloba macropyga]|uniref:uncharacterized protein LOC142340357 n=1 Tax=Convolutriloba macropyga TaxID=536237 RepID=UPI003F5217D9
MDVLCVIAYKFAPVADAFTLYYSNAVISLIFESIAFRRWPQRLHILAVAMTIIGIVIVSRPPILFGHITDGSKIGANGNSSSEKDVENESSGHTRFLGCSLAIAAAVTTSVWMTFSRRIEQMNVAFVTFLQSLVPVIGYGLMFKMITKEEFCISGNLVALSLLCLNYCLNLPMLNVCLTLEPSYIVTSVRCLATVTSYAIQIASGSRPPWYTFLGASLIASSVLIVSYTKWKDSTQTEVHLHMTDNNQ